MSMHANICKDVTCIILGPPASACPNIVGAVLGMDLITSFTELFCNDLSDNSKQTSSTNHVCVTLFCDDFSEDSKRTL